MNFKVGQKVWSYTYGWGVIEEIIDCIYPISCRFENENMNFTKDGKTTDIAINQDLFYDEIKIEIPESAIKPKVEWKFPCYGITKDNILVYFIEFRNGIVIRQDIAYDVGTHIVSWDMSLFTPCTIEAKEITNG